MKTKEKPGGVKKRGISTGRKPVNQEPCKAVGFYYPIRLHADLQKRAAELLAENPFSGLPADEQARYAAEMTELRAKAKAARAFKKGGKNV